jgi:hypothetical protein
MEMKMVLKGCRRCGGDLFPDGEDREGRSMYCLQCGSPSASANGPPARRDDGPRAA